MINYHMPKYPKMLFRMLLWSICMSSLQAPDWSGLRTRKKFGIAARPRGCVVCPSPAGGRRQYFLHGPRHSQHLLLLDQFISSADIK